MSDSDSGDGQPQQFPNTSLTLHQRLQSDNPLESKKAMEEFLNRYWNSMYVFMRAQGESHHDASDLVQEFSLTQLISQGQLVKWEPGRAKLRSYLKTILDRFRKKEYRKESAQKRGGPKAITHISMDFDLAQSLYDSGAQNHDSPDLAFDREWAESIIQKVMANLSGAYNEKGKLEEFQLLIRNLSGRSSEADRITYREIALKLQTSEENVKQKMIALRTRFQKSLSALVQDTVSPEEFEDEMNFILGVTTGSL